MSTNIWPSVDPKKIIFVGASKKAFSKECVGNKDFLVAVCITLSTTRSSYIRFQFGMMFFFWRMWTDRSRMLRDRIGIYSEFAKY